MKLKHFLASTIIELKLKYKPKKGEWWSMPGASHQVKLRDSQSRVSLGSLIRLLWYIVSQHWTGTAICFPVMNTEHTHTRMHNVSARCQPTIEVANLSLRKIACQSICYAPICVRLLFDARVSKWARVCVYVRIL